MKLEYFLLCLDLNRSEINQMFNRNKAGLLVFSGGGGGGERWGLEELANINITLCNC